MFVRSFLHTETHTDSRYVNFPDKGFVMGIPAAASEFATAARVASKSRQLGAADLIPKSAVVTSI